jgi:hypothetical protein
MDVRQASELREITICLRRACGGHGVGQSYLGLGRYIVEME